MAEEPLRKRAMSHKEYLETLHPPSTADIKRITNTQLVKEREIDGKYHGHSAEENQAAERIQKAYRGHRDRRQLEGLTLDPSSRWLEALKELRYRSATAPSKYSDDEAHPASLSTSPHSKARWNWRRIGCIAEHAGAGESTDTAENDSMLLDLRYFLEMTDTKHRYGTNLQVYHEEWQRSQTHQNFFIWLDSGEGKHLSLTMCSREKLTRERIRYLSKEERKDYLVQVDANGQLRWEKNGEPISTSAELYRDSVHGIVPKASDEPAFVSEADDDAESSSDLENLEEDETHRRSHRKEIRDKTAHKLFRASPATILSHLLRKSVRPGTWIYVVDTVGRLYVGIKASGAFQHASFLSGARILSAGLIGIRNGQLVYLSPLSGHYRPTTKSFRAFLASLEEQGCDLSHVRIAHAYQILRGLEHYGTMKAGLSKLHHHNRLSGSVPSSLPDHMIHAVNDTATDIVQQNWQNEHEQKHGLARLMNDLHIRRRSGEHKRNER